MDEGDFLQVLVSQNATSGLGPSIVKASATIFDLVPVFHVKSAAEYSTLTGKVEALRYGLIVKSQSSPAKPSQGNANQARCRLW